MNYNLLMTGYYSMNSIFIITISPYILPYYDIVVVNNFCRFFNILMV